MRIQFFILFISLAFSVSGQGLHSKRKKAIQLYEEAVSLDQIGNYCQSEKLLLEALRKDKSFDEAIVLLHQVYIKRDLFSSSESVLIQSVNELAPELRNRILLDQAYFLNAEGDYEQARSKIDQIEGKIWNVSDKLLNSLRETNQFAIDLVKNKLNVVFEELPLPLNQFDLQYFPSITFQNQLVFTVRQKADGGDENLYLSEFRDLKWTKPEQLSGTINTDRNEGTASISADGKTLVFTSCNRPGNIGSCDLYISYKDENWSEPEILPEEVNSPEWDSQPSLSADGNTLYFTSLRKGGLGKQDIWYSERKNGHWERAENLGAEINTPLDDASPFIYYDNHTLIYATKGRSGLGGFDLFRVEKTKQGWSEPINLGYPINNEFDQVGYSISFDGWAYFSSASNTGKLLLKRFQVPKEVISTFQHSLVSVFDDNAMPKSSSLVISLSDDKETYLSSPEGTFSIPQQNVKSFLVQASGYYSVEYQSPFPDSIQVNLEPVRPGETLQYSDINFDSNSSVITADEERKLEPVLKLLLNNPTLLVEIGGYTDAIGTDEANLELSLERAMSVKGYLVKKGITEDNLVVRGYGESNLLISSGEDLSLRKNRRIEFRVVRFLEKTP